jgi:DNA polymerase III alpha subunit (gram-positive type)
MTNDMIVFAQLKADITAYVAPTKAMKVTDFKSSQSVIDATKSLIAYKKQVETTRKTLVDPFNARVKAINAYAKEISEPLEQAESYLRQQLIAFETEMEKQRQAEQRRMEDERRAREQEEMEKAAAALAAIEEKSDLSQEADSVFGGDPESQAVVEAEKETMIAQIEVDRKVREGEYKSQVWELNQNKIKNSSKVWKCELIDINLVPKEFLIRELNEAAVKAAARGGVTEIPGVRVYQETSLRICSKTYVPQTAIENEG